ncbi:hypothetical protein AB1046_05965 [Promicromonospora sp. Populi]|uniref:hypothetical protein n=1 Tax=Promicromonospora sp. Populi TaxID=3239420 RepID=UPI0034E1A640
MVKTRKSRLVAVMVVGVALAGLTACTADAPEDPDGGASPSATHTGTPTPTATPSEEPTDQPTEASAPYEDGYQPPWFEGTQWSCGMPAADLASVSDQYTLDITGEVTDVANGEPSHNGDRFLPVTLTGPDGAVYVSPPATVWTQAGVVVELPALADSAPVETAGGEHLDPVLGILSHCAPSGDGGAATYETQLPDGDYEVRAFVEIDPVQDPRQFVLSDPVDVSVTADGIVQR